jgi:hypothetical protein
MVDLMIQVDHYFTETLNLSNFSHILNVFSMNKFCQALSGLRFSSHRLQIESERWVRPVRVAINERKYNLCG